MLRSSFTTRLAKNLLSSIDIAEDDEIDNNHNGNYKDKTVKKLLLPKNLNRVIGYLTPNAKQIFI